MGIKILTTLSILALAILLMSTALAADEEKQVLAKWQTLGTTLRAALLDGMSQGIDQAMVVCKEKAPKIAAEVSTETLEVGRVSHKPRNDKNALREWMKPAVNKFLSSELTSVFKTIKINEKQLGYLKPIMTEATCLACHGSALTPEITAIISKHYPNDKATGFSENDIRGFFYAIVTTDPSKQ